MLQIKEEHFTVKDIFEVYFGKDVKKSYGRRTNLIFLHKFFIVNNFSELTNNHLKDIVYLFVIISSHK